MPEATIKIAKRDVVLTTEKGIILLFSLGLGMPPFWGSLPALVTTVLSFWLEAFGLKCRITPEAVVKRVGRIRDLTRIKFARRHGDMPEKSCCMMHAEVLSQSCGIFCRGSGWSVASDGPNKRRWYPRKMIHGRLSLDWRDAENPANILKIEIYCNIFNYYIVASFFRSVILLCLTIALKIKRLICQRSRLQLCRSKMMPRTPRAMCLPIVWSDFSILLAGQGSWPQCPFGQVHRVQEGLLYSFALKTCWLMKLKLLLFDMNPTVMPHHQMMRVSLSHQSNWIPHLEGVYRLAEGHGPYCCLYLSLARSLISRIEGSELWTSRDRYGSRSRVQAAATAAQGIHVQGTKHQHPRLLPISGRIRVTPNNTKWWLSERIQGAGWNDEIPEFDVILTRLYTLSRISFMACVCVDCRQSQCTSRRLLSRTAVAWWSLVLSVIN